MKPFSEVDGMRTAVLSVRTTPGHVAVLDPASQAWLTLERGDSFMVQATESFPAWYVRRVTGDARFKVEVWIESKKGKIRKWGGMWRKLFFRVLPRITALFRIGPHCDPGRDPEQKMLLERPRRYARDVRESVARRERHRVNAQLARLCGQRR